MKEEWRNIPEYEGLYAISNLGRVKSLARIVKRKDGTRQKYETRILRHHISNKGYHQVELRKNSRSKYPLIHRLVAEVFIENPDNKPQVNHIDGNKGNNRIDNLEWVTSSENAIHAFKNHLRTPNGPTSLSEDQIRYIREHYKFRDAEYSTVAMAKKLGVGKETVARVVRGNTYKNVNGFV